MSGYENLNENNAFIWRIMHIKNIPWVLSNGLHCGNSQYKSDTWVNIGNTELISKRQFRKVPIRPFGVLNDYIPFYFTPFSPMLYNIHTGRGNVVKQRNEDIVIAVSKLHNISKLGLSFAFTDRHAYLETAHYYNDVKDLGKIDWKLLQSRSFSRDENDPEKMERYQAEALIHQHVPTDALSFLICFSESAQKQLEQQVQQAGSNLKVLQRAKWYF